MNFLKFKGKTFYKKRRGDPNLWTPSLIRIRFYLRYFIAGNLLIGFLLLNVLATSELDV